ncbi:F-box domain, cyclin-like protein [Cynara cardunculus var. scolymus]|uniref:F-box domain, cyclin-like protein n=1 Tax=Cynara cardunculus var. scolymus TaxID=59895 RepID=A0A103XRN5_CYNCS|nr:F-box domain, cyclin-like protein [Cynara cardunculus var. scolymus]
MDFDHENVRPVMNEDRLSSLPNELIHQILSCIDTKSAVQTCLLSSRWKRLWTSVPCLNFASGDFSSLPKFSKFVTHVLSNRNHQIDVTSLNLTFHGAASQFFVGKIADYAFAHNVQELNVVISPKRHHAFPPCLFSSQSLQRFTLKSTYLSPYLLPKTPWDFPALTTLHIQEVVFSGDMTEMSVDLFSKCVNLKNLKLHLFDADRVAVFDIITPKLSNLTLTNSNFNHINVTAPELENLTATNCSIKKLNAPTGLSSLTYSGSSPVQLKEYGFDSLNKVSIHLSIYRSRRPYKEEVARKTINMLHGVHSARFLTLNADVVECISSYPELISHHPSPFSNLICVNVDTSMRKDAHKIKMCTEARNFLLENSPSATFIMELPEAPLTRAMRQKVAWEKRKAKQVEDFESHITELQASLEVVTSHIGVGTKERVSAAFGNLMEELEVLNKQMKKYAEMQMPVNQRKVQLEREARARIEACAGEMQALVNQEKDEVLTIFSKKDLIRSLLQKFPKRQMAEIEARYSRQIEESEAQIEHLFNEHLTSKRFVDDHIKFMSCNIVMFPDLTSINIPLASQPSSSSSPIILTPSTLNNSML